MSLGDPEIGSIESPQTDVRIIPPLPPCLYDLPRFQKVGYLRFLNHFDTHGLGQVVNSIYTGTKDQWDAMASFQRARKH
jgi:hypothetical protein